MGILPDLFETAKKEFRSKGFSEDIYHRIKRESQIELIKLFISKYVTINNEILEKLLDLSESQEALLPDILNSDLIKKFSALDIIREVSEHNDDKVKRAEVRHISGLSVVVPDDDVDLNLSSLDFSSSPSSDGCGAFPIDSRPLLPPCFLRYSPPVADIDDISSAPKEGGLKRGRDDLSKGTHVGRLIKTPINKEGRSF